MKIKYQSLLLSLWLLGWTNSFAQSNWHLQKEENGIRVFVRDKPGSNFKEMKLQTDIRASVEAVLSILSDKKKFPDWVYGCSEAGMLKVVNENQFYHYQVTNVQWPVQDRELIVHSTIIRHPETKVVEIISKAAPSFNKEGGQRLRIKNFNATWKFVPKANGYIAAEYIVSMDLGGNVPAWLVNLFITEGPIRTLQKMEELLPYYESRLVQLEK